MRARAFLSRFAALAAGVLAAALLAPGAAHAATYASACAGCHGATPAGARLNAGNAPSVIAAANTNHSMGVGGIAIDFPAIATEIGAFLSGPQGIAVGYNSAANPVTIQDLFIDVQGLGPVISTTVVSAAPSKGTLGGVGTPSSFGVTYTHTANDCVADQFDVAGTGAATTAPRRVNVTITHPAAPSAAGSVSNIAYNTGPTAIGLTLGGGPSSTLSITSPLSPNVGTLNVSGTSVTYSASSSNYAPALTFSYQAVGPCGETSAPATVTINVSAPPAPVISSPGTASGTGGQPFSYQIVASNAPTGYLLQSGTLPTGVTLNPATGLISGTPTQTGSFPVVVAASNGTGTGTLALTITINLATPVISSPATASGAAGSLFTYTITASNLPASYNVVGALPTGVTFDSVTGVISGTPTVGGSFPVTIQAINGAGTGSQGLTITISTAPPVITSPGTATGTGGQAFSYQITANNVPLTFGVTGALPTGLAINASGLISGTPTQTGTFPVTISATNGSGTGTQALTITINLVAPVITSAGSASGSPGVAFTYQITAGNLPASYGATGLPPGLAVNPATGLISGTPTTSGTFGATISATNAAGTGTQALTIAIALLPPVITSASVVTAIFGQPFSYQITANNNPLTFGATGLPPGLAVNATTGLITGTPTAGGVFGAVMTATNGAGTAVQSLNLTITIPPVTTQDVTVEVPGTAGAPITLPVSGPFTQINIVTPPANGTLTGPTPGSASVTYTPNPGFSGTDSFTYVAVGPGGPSAPATVRITVAAVAPTAAAASLTVPLNASATRDLASAITGSGVTGIAIAMAPAHGSATVNGTKVTYTPKKDYFGGDSFTYYAFGTAGASAPAPVTVTITGRPDPTADPNVPAMINAQTQAARRFAGAQVTNFQRRMESLHRAPPAPAETAKPAEPAKAARSPSPVDRFADAPIPSRFDAALETPGRNARADPLESALASTLLSLATSRTVDVSSRSNASGAAETQFWVGGQARFGNEAGHAQMSGGRFSTQGLSVGADRRVGDSLVLGIGAGYAQDEATFGTEGSRNKARGSSFSAYGSWQPAHGYFLDALLGFGRIDLDARRHVGAVGAFATSSRTADQWFGSLAAGYEYRNDGILVSPYGRLDFSVDKFKAATESGVGAYALAYRTETQNAMQVALGVRAESEHETSFGRAVPRLRAEYRHDFTNAKPSAFTYADLLSGPTYLVAPAGTSRHSFLLGFGADFLYGKGLKLGFDYQAEHTKGLQNVQAVRFLVTKELDGRDLPPFRWTATMLADPVTVDAGYAWDDNVTRGRDPVEKRMDAIYSLGTSLTWPYPLTDNLRVLATGIVSGEKFQRYAGLGRFSAGLQGELQYRASGAFDATTYSIVARGAHEQFESQLRTGQRYYVGFNARRPLTDRIDFFGELGANVRQAQSDVFTWKDYAAKVNLDYSRASGVAYLTGEYRRGDTSSTGVGSLVNLALAEVFAPDDAFPGENLFAYRIQATTLMGTLGYNYPLGPRDSLDFSWRRVQSIPKLKPSFEGVGTLRYIDNFYSIVYLMRF